MVSAAPQPLIVPSLVEFLRFMVYLAPFGGLVARAISAGLGMCLLSAAVSPRAAAESYTPDHPRVRGMIDQAVEYITRQQQFGGGIGYEIFAGYTVYQATENAEHPAVVRGLEKALTFVRGIEEGKASLLEFNYVCSLCGQLLSSVDPGKYKGELKIILDEFQRRQRPAGCYTYPEGGGHDNQGDASQTQYALLCLWSLDHADVEVPPEVVERVLGWLKAAQRPDGGFMYMTPDPSGRPYHAMTAAGISSAMIAGDILGVLRSGGGSALEAAKDALDPGVPAAFRRYRPEEEGRVKKVGQDDVATIAVKGKSWIDSRPYQRTQTTWHYYWMYSIERYEALWDAMNGKRDLSPEWYNQGVEQLIRSQSAEGAFGIGEPDAGAPFANTCFAVLFLLRTTQKSIGDLNEAIFAGGQGLSADMSVVDLSGGRIEDKKQITDIDAALANLSDDVDNQQAAAIASRIKLDPDPKKRATQLEGFARMLRASDAASRIIAAKLLARSDNLDMVPHLIYALTDVEPDVNRYAENSLRVLSRQLNTRKIPLAGDVTGDQRRAAIKYWQDWYRTVRPDYVFLE